VDYNDETIVSMMIDEAEKLFYKLVKDSINKIITDFTFSKSSSLPLLSPSSNEEQQKTYEIKSNCS
jgi:hypothetical protein